MARQHATERVAARMTSGRPISARRPALILDRDGVINVDKGFVHRVEDCVFIDGIFDLVAAFRSRGFVAVVVTNQSGIARGYFDEATFTRLMEWMKDEFQRRGTALDAVYFCPDHPTDGIGVYRRDLGRRKPAPGMIREAARDLDLDLAASWAIGDKERDITAARAAGVGTLVLFDGTASATRRDGDVWVVPDLAAAAALLGQASPG
jgi:D-glycero-D-manno-heptose 1,7-bisphosphate phosphatase